MTRLFLAAVVAALPAFADEAAEKLAVMRTVLALNEIPERQSIFTSDATIDPEFYRLWEGRPIRTRPLVRAGRPTVEISHEPWGEATIRFPQVRFEIVNPRIVTDGVHVVTDEVAIADAASVYDSPAGRERKKLLLVLRKSAAEWKIAVIRVVDRR